jgi:hypothetical protein
MQSDNAPAMARAAHWRSYVALGAAPHLRAVIATFNRLEATVSEFHSQCLVFAGNCELFREKLAVIRGYLG